MRGILWITVNRFDLPAPRYNDAAHHHVTLRFNVERDDVANWIGKEVQLYASDVCWDDDIEALRVIMTSDLTILCQNENPHITLSHRKGIKPFQSNAMLAGEHNIEPLGLVLDGVIEFHKFGE